MERRKSDFSWYWLLEPDMIFAIGLVCFVGLSLVFPHRPYFLLAVSICIGLAMAAASAYQRKLYERFGADRVRPPKLVNLLWWTLIAGSITGLVARVILYLWATGQLR